MYIEIKRWDNNKVIHSGNFQSVKECLEDGVKKGVSFYCARLNGAKLNRAKLNRAKLNYAELNYAKLNSAKLNYAELNNAKLNYAKLNDAKLKDTKLNGTKLNCCIGNMKEIKSMWIEKYKIAYTKDALFIGCHGHAIEKWENFTDSEILEMDGKTALKFWRKYKEAIFVMIRASFPLEESSSDA